MIKHLLLLLVIVLHVGACKQNNNHPDVSNISSDIEVVRFEKLLQEMDIDNLEAEISELQNKYPAFTGLYFSTIVPLINQDQLVDLDGMANFLNSEQIRFQLDTVAIEYKDFKRTEKELKKAAQFLRHYFPDYEVPNFYTLISDYGYQNFIFSDGEKDGIGIGLDLYLGETFPYKNIDPSNPSYSDYLTRTYNRDHIAKKSFSLIVDDLIGEPNGKRMLDLMIHEGKKMFVLKKILPFKSDTIIMEYTPSQVDWVQNNEYEVWTFFLDKELLYETSHLEINRYLAAGPNSTGMPVEAPGRTAAFIGYQIINSYMSKYPETSLQELIGLYDAQEILEKAKYKPRRK